MYLPPYSLADLDFAYRCYVYFRWHTYRRRPVAILKQVTPTQLAAIYPEIHVLELTSTDSEMAVLASLRPVETVSSAASKLKGACSKLIGDLAGHVGPVRSLAAGYFAATTGANNSDQLDQYLDSQAAHHGYDRFALPPVWVQDWELTEADLESLQTKHAVVSLCWHIVLSTWNRVGIFTAAAAQAICDRWAQDALDWRVRFRKVSAVPDHLHAAVWTHPTVAPAELVVKMMNSSQEIMQNDYPQLLIDGGQPRLWKPGAYVGSFGDITKDHIRNYLRKWELREQGSNRGQVT